MKQCSVCKTEKEESEFYKDTRRPSGLQSACKSCEIKSQKKYRTTEKYKKQQKLYHKKETYKQWQNNYGKTSKRKEGIKKYQQSPKGRLSAKSHRETDKHRKTQRAYENKKRIVDIQFKLANILRIRLYSALKNNQKVGSAVSDLGCTIPELIVHLEEQFQEGMTWINWKHKGWHIDHRKPLSSFDLTDREQFLQACHYTNLQPLWWLDNLKKSNKTICQISSKSLKIT